MIDALGVVSKVNTSSAAELGRYFKTRPKGGFIRAGEVRAPRKSGEVKGSLEMDPKSLQTSTRKVFPAGRSTTPGMVPTMKKPLGYGSMTGREQQAFRSHGYHNTLNELARSDDAQVARRAQNQLARWQAGNARRESIRVGETPSRFKGKKS